MRDLWERALRITTTRNRWSLSLDLDERIPAVHGRWKPKRWNERRRHARRQKQTHVSSTLYALKQQEVICRSFNPMRFYWPFFFLCDSEFIPERRISVCDLHELAAKALEWVTYNVSIFWLFVLNVFQHTWRCICHFVTVPVTLCRISRIILKHLFFNDRVVARNHSLATVERVICRWESRDSRLLPQWRENYRLRRFP